MKYLRHIIQVFFILAAAGCAKDEVRPEIPASDIPIFFKGSPETKAVFDPDNFQTDGNAIVVNDRFDYDGSSMMYFDNVTATRNGSIYWDYGTPKYWSADGIHYFTAYTSVNATEGTGTSAGSLPAGKVSYNSADRSITVNEWTLTLDNQFDFCYGSHTRDLTAADKSYAPVNIKLKHLFAAVCFKVYNQQINDTSEDNRMNFESFSLSGVLDKGSATIAYDSDAVPGTPGKSADTNLFPVSENSTLMEYNIPHNVYAGKGKVGSDGCLLMWPHDFTQYKDIKVELTYSINSSAATEETTTVLISSSNQSQQSKYQPVTEGTKRKIKSNTPDKTVTEITVISNLKSTGNNNNRVWTWLEEIYEETVTTVRGTETKPFSKSISLGDQTTGTTSWQAGNRYIYNFYIQDNNISFVLEVVPWETDDIILEE